jgi:AcrR family transcriptional regulator
MKTTKAGVVKARPPKGEARESRSEKTDRLRRELIEEGLRQFRANGFDAVPVDAIIRGLDVSKRTFFRYFRTKEDLVFTWMDELGELARPALMEAVDRMPLDAAMRSTFRTIARYIDHDPDRAAFITELIFSTQSLNGRYQSEHMVWENEFYRIAHATGQLAKGDEFAARIRITLAIAAWIGALREWAEGGHRSPLLGFVEAAFAILDGSHVPSKRVNRA